MQSTSKPNYNVCIGDKKVCRQEEITYCQQIYQEYIQKNGQQHLIRRMFQILHSDWLNIEEFHLNHNSNSIKVLKSKSKFQQGDVILEIRGSIMNKNKLDALVRQKAAIKNMISQLNCLLWGEKQSEVLVPKGLGKTLLNGSSQYYQFLSESQENKNCVIEYELGSKYLITTCKPIEPDEVFILDLASLNRFQYTHEFL